MKKKLYWLGYAVLLVGGIAISLSRLLPVCNTYIFLMGMVWAWTGLMMVLNLTEYRKAYSRSETCKRIHGIIFLVMGAVWVPLSLTPLCNRGMPVLLCSAPFLALLMLTASYDKKKRLNDKKE